MAGDIDQVIQKLRINGVFLAIAEIPQQDFERGERVRRIGTVPKVLDIQPLVGVQIGQRNPPRTCIGRRRTGRAEQGSRPQRRRATYHRRTAQCRSTAQRGSA